MLYEVITFLAARAKSPLYIRFRAAFPAVWKRLVEPFFRSAGLVRPSRHAPYNLANSAPCG